MLFSGAQLVELAAKQYHAEEDGLKVVSEQKSAGVLGGHQKPGFVAAKMQKVVAGEKNHEKGVAASQQVDEELDHAI